MKTLIAVCLLFLFVNCNDQNKNKSAFVSPPGYNINKPEKIKIKETLNEISGIVYSNDGNALLAVDDEQGKIFNIDLTNNSDYTLSKFAPNGDYEDLAYTGKEWFVLKSNGELYLAKNIFTDSVTHEKFPFPEKGNEFEGLYYDDASNCLWLLCKSCAADNDKKEVSIYAFDVATRQFKPGAVWQIDVNKIKEQLSLKQLSFKPSAISLHTLQNQLYILSGVNKILLITDRSGNIQSSYQLDPFWFKQAEGITFSGNGDMYISNEATNDTYATILKFTYQPATK
ncbi:hypothetical protein BH10BAC2_BH10BAC2_47540 [soil metagenome]